MKKKIFAKILILFVVGLTLTFATQAQNAYAAECGSASDYFENFGDCFFQGEEGSPSFTDFRGGLTAPSTEGYDPSLTQVTSAREFVIRVVNFALMFLGLIAVVIIIYGGFRYLLSAGESEGTEKGKKSILYAVIGILIIAASFAIVNTVLKAPSGSDKGTVIEKPNLNLPSLGFLSGPYSSQLLTLSRELLSSYGTYAGTKLTLDSVEVSLENGWKKIKFRNFDDRRQAINDIESRLREIKGALDKVASHYDEISPIRERISQHHVFIAQWLEKTRIETEQLQRATDCGQPSEGKSPLDFVNECTNKIESAYYGDFLTKWDEFANQLKEKYKEIKTEAAAELEDRVRDVETKVKKIHKDVENSLTPEIAAQFDDLLQQPSLFEEILKQKDDPVTAKGVLRAILKKMELLYQQLKNIKSVSVKLTSNIYEGNAPLIVSVSTVGSSDPSQKSIDPKIIEWELPTIEGAKCDINGAVGICTFKKPGSYKVGVKIPSTDPAKFAPGRAYIAINVKPPSAQINLLGTVGTKIYPVIQYDIEGKLINNRETLNLALSKAQEGIELDASQTKDAEELIWNMGNGTGEITGTKDQKQTARYSKEGMYRMLLRVKSKDGTENRKILDVNVSEMTAIADIEPGNIVRVGTPIKLKGYAGNDRGKYTTEWIATPKNNKDNPEAKKLNSLESELTAVLENPEKWDLKFLVKNENEEGKQEQAEDSIELTVKSNPPIAKFRAIGENKNRPADFLLDSSPSFDPDGPNKDLVYNWMIEGEEGKHFKFIEGNKNSEKPVVRFLQKGEYPVRLEVRDANEGDGTFAQTVVKVDNLLDVEWDKNNPVSAQLNTDQKVAVNFVLFSTQAQNFDVDFGDNEVEGGVFENGKATITHTFNEAGIRMIRVNVYDEDNNKNSITRKIIIGGSSKPLAVAKVLINGQEIDTSDIIIVNRKTNISFTAAGSKNTKGDSSGLSYSWNFGDGKKSAKNIANYIYKEISPPNPGYYKVVLTVTDEKDPTKTDTDESIRILVTNEKPTLKSMVVIPQKQDLITPISIQVKAYEPRDLDGTITAYKWWYYDLRDPDTKIATKITTTPSVLFNIGTRGQEGDLVEYAFGLEMKDDEGQIATVGELLPVVNGQIPTNGNILDIPTPTIAVINGPNKSPVAKFAVDKTNVKAGDIVTLTSLSTDPDGSIVTYIWDIEGDGFQNNFETDKSTVTVNFNNAATKGIPVRLKVIDNNFGEATSPVVTIYVAPLSNPPVAAFTAEGVKGTNKIQFKNNSTSDTAKGSIIVSYSWDFNLGIDSNGDGKKDNDVDSTQKDPTHEYPARGKYSVRLTVKDNQGIVSAVTNAVDAAGIVIPATTSSTSSAVPKGAAASTTPENIGAFPSAPVNLNLKSVTDPEVDFIDGKIHLKGTSGSVKFDFSGSTGNIARYEIDKNIYFDGNGNGIKDDDADYISTTNEPWTSTFQKDWGKIGVKVSAFDVNGNKDSVLREIIFLGGVQNLGNNIFVIPGAASLYGALAGMFGFGILAASRKKRRIRSDH